MSRREALLVKVVAAVLAAALVLAAFIVQEQRGADARRRIALATATLEKLRARAPDEAALQRQKELLAAGLAVQRERFYKEREMDAYKFGLIIRGLLIHEGLKISRYRTMEATGRTYLEFTVSGSAAAMARFLQRVSTSEHVWVLPVLSIDAHDGSGDVRAVFRIGYETVIAAAR